MADIGASNWSETDASNSTAAPDGAPEGMAPSGVNDTIRAMMGATKRWYDWTIPKTTAGTATAYTLTYTVAPGALVDGMTHLVQFHAANGAAATLNVNGLGAIPLHYYSSGTWRTAPAALFDDNQIFRVMYHSGSGAYRIMRPGAEPTGVVKTFAGSAIPGGYLLCYGQAVSRTTYAGLFNTIGTAHGTGDGATTFNLPDLRGRVAAGKDDMGGPAANRLTGSGSGISSATLGATGGSETHTLTTAQIPVHSHGLQTRADLNATGPSATAVYMGGGGGAQTTDAAGGGGAHQNTQPTIILNQIIAI